MTFKLFIVLFMVTNAAAQWQCGGTTYTPGSVNFTTECMQTAQNCISQFAANISQEYCQDTTGNLYMQQIPSNGNNNDYTSAFQDILDFCLLDGSYTGTWATDDGQWFWMAAGSGCYSSNGTIPTNGPGFCVQDRTDTVINGCYPQPDPNSGALQVLKTGPTGNGFTGPARGWNSWGIQATPATTPSWQVFNQSNVIKQCSVLAQPEFKQMGYDLCSLDAGWSTNVVDEYGRIQYNSTLFDLGELGDYLHGIDLKMGVYIIPGVPCSAANRTIQGTDILIGDVLNGNNNGEDFCDWDFSKDGVQQWHDSLIELWGSWGVDMIKLDFITPGSPYNGANLVCNNSAAVEAYHNAIAQSGRQIRLDLSWKLCRNETYLPLWSKFGESMRTDQDIDNYGEDTFVAWQEVQRAIDNYRQYISLQKQRGVAITIYPDMDNLFVGNAANVTGVSDTQRITIMNHWLGAAANLVIGSDLTQLDALGIQLLTSSQSGAFANFSAQYPMQPRNPGSGNNLAQQLQAWIAGPSQETEAYVILANYGPDQGASGFDTSLAGVQAVTVSLNDLGISGQAWNFTDVWNGNSTVVTGSFTAYLNEYESQLLHLKS
ncbi:Alpha-D-galactoside galactohydrolase 3 [Hyphodiscus hymeniophilus]|uniref:alpha-galactosidase n=1 Tax=Hyphodiscus hymeniophilus TaxID=353542 RepID=A0A9P6VEH6_9HELO|nr:Alpha-D-galactoside galactohydrolase 3 [Hyphodiscus hymeniophilus]